MTDRLRRALSSHGGASKAVPGDRPEGPLPDQPTALYLDSVREQAPTWGSSVTYVRRQLPFSKGKPPMPYLNRPTEGVPLMPSHLYGSDTFVQHHAYRWGRGTTVAAHFLPESHSLMVSGPPMQVLLGVQA